ncbi:hypothetical protein ACFFX0_19530 [Citricoccus parietis]|uniref:Lipoprotein n=1 Tax=Citricoccus parietis TaxID=592307 RepID=A0ABV5G2W4_9MICC
MPDPTTPKTWAAPMRAMTRPTASLTFMAVWGPFAAVSGCSTVVLIRFLPAAGRPGPEPHR